MIKRLFSPPVFDNEEDNFRAKFINGFAWIVSILLLVVLVSNLGPGTDENSATTIIFSTGLIFVMLLSLYLLRRGNLNAGGLLIVILGWLGLGIQAYTADGVRDIIIIAYIAVSLLASIIINWRAGSIVMILSIGVIWTLAILEVNGYLQPGQQETIAFSRDLSLVFIAIAVLIYFSTTSLRDAITRATKSEQNLLASNKNLQELNQTLEERVNLRTAELDTANRFNLQRARQFEAIAQVVRAISSIQDLETLLSHITQLISQHFEFYHVGIFLVEDNRENAILSAANSEGGKRMLARGHKLRVGETSIVGYVTGTGNPRIAIDTGADAVFFNNPDLPDTHSEITLPLRIAGELVGAMDVQSTEFNAFKQEDVEVLSTLADQVSIAIQNARSFRESQKLLTEAQSATSDHIFDAWKVLRPTSAKIGYQKLGTIIKPLEKLLEGEHIRQAVENGETVAESSNLTVPIRLRGQVIGVMNLQVPQGHTWNSDEVDIAEAVAERLSLAIETSTLLKATQHRADIERITTDIAGKLSSSTRFETILQTAAQELSRALGGSDVLVQLEPVAMKMQSDI